MAKNISNFILTLLIASFLLFSLIFNVLVTPKGLPDLGHNGHEFSVLADSFLHGRLDLWKYPKNKLDCVVVDEKCFWDQGPFPAVLLLPFVFIFNQFHLPFFQGYLNIWLIILNLFLCFKIAQKFQFSKPDSFWLALAFCFGSVYVGIAFNSLSWYYSQAVATALILLAILEYLNKKRYWLIGLIFGFIFATRVTAGLGIIFFILEIIFSQQIASKEKIKKLIILLSPIFAIGLILLYYNFLRFDDLFETGYKDALIGDLDQRVTRDRYGLFNLIYLPANFYYYFLALPKPKTSILNGFDSKDNWLGLSFFIVSPIFIKIFFQKIKNQIIKLSWITSLIILLIILTYYNTGSQQLGPRYMLDFFPFWFLILLFSFKKNKLTGSHKTLITLSLILNLILFVNFYTSNWKL